MSTFRHPVGEKPPAVYWRRRLMVGLAVVVVIVVIVLIIVGHRGGKAKPVAVPPSSAAAASTSTPKPASTDAPACDTRDLTVTATVDKATYSAKAQPQLGFTLTNDGATACVAKAGSDVQVFEITSGSEVYWNSTDCQTGAQSYTKVMQPGSSISSGKIAWDRTWSSKSTCNGDRLAVSAGGASYHLVVIVDGVKSSNSPQFVLD